MATISIAEELVDNHSTEEVLSWLQTELTTIRQITLSKEADKSFLLGRVSSISVNAASVADALRKKLSPKAKADQEPPIVA